MFFVLSKILSFLTQPTTWIVLLFIFSFVAKGTNRRNLFFYVALGTLILFSNPYLSNAIFRIWEVEPTPLSEVENHDIAIVFSGMTMEARELNDRIYFNKAADRIAMAVHLYKIGKVNKILISGGYGTISKSGTRESETLSEYLLMLGIPKSDIIQEKEADNTYQNALYTKKIIEKNYANQKCILITSAFHMRRSMRCTEKVGLDCTPFAVDYHTFVISSLEDVIVPKSYALYNWDILIHEIIGYLVYWSTGKF